MSAALDVLRAEFRLDPLYAEADMHNGKQKVNSRRMTRELCALALAAVLGITFPAHGQQCSGGSGGGTDATGNQCNDPVAIPLSAEGHGVAASASAPTTGRDSPSNRATTGAPVPAAAVGAAAHRKMVFDERRARFNDNGRAQVAAVRRPVVAAP